MSRPRWPESHNSLSEIPGTVQQQGVFLIPGDVSKSFMMNLRRLMLGVRSHHVIKIVIPRRQRLDVLEHLYSMDISRATLFPGLPGYAQSFGVYHPVYRPIQWGHSGVRKRRKAVNGRGR